MPNQSLRRKAAFTFFGIMLATMLAPASDGKTGLAAIRVPPGFTVELAAKPEDTPYSMFACFDDRGRLFVAQSSGKNIKGALMPEQPECKILRLEDKDGDGFFETTQVYADKVGIPMGVLWHQGSVYAASPPDLLRFDDANDDGVSEKREALLTGWKVMGTASLHGPFLGPDGWLYLTDGRHGFDIKTKEGTHLKGLAARIWRVRPDGTQLQSFCGGGFDNPVEVTFLPGGEMLGTMTYFTDPQNGQRDGLMHWLEGGVYRKYYSCVSEFKLTGELMPPMTKFARIAPAGLMRYQSPAWGADYQGDLFTAQFNPHRVQRHQLFRDGATFRTEDEDFLTSTDPDFHPCDVLEDADGSLLVVDTGGWYVDQCPLSRVARPEQRGAIYRVRKTSAPPVADGRGLKLNLAQKTPEELVKLLEDSRLAVRDQAIELLSKNEKATSHLAKVIAQSANSELRCAAIWALFRQGTPAAQTAIRNVLRDHLQEGDLTVRLAATTALGLNRDAKAAPFLGMLLYGAEPALRREAATALGGMNDKQVATLLLSAAAKTHDRFEEHAIIYALIRLKNQAALTSALSVPDPKTRKAALIALDQMDGSPLQREQLAPLLQSKDQELWQAALWVVSHHPDWADAVIGALQAKLSAAELLAEEMELLRPALFSFAGNAGLQEMLAGLLASKTIPTDRKLFLLDAMDRGTLAKLPASWMQQLGDLLDHGDTALQSRAVQLVRTRKIASLDGKLKSLVENEKSPSVLKISALSALLARESSLNETAFTFLLTHFQPGTDAALRTSAAHVLGKAKLSDAQLLRVAGAPLAQADAMTLPALIEPFRQATNEAVGQALVAALLQCPASSDLLGGEKLGELLKSFSAKVKASSRPLQTQIEAQQAARMQRLKELSGLLTGGDVGRGRRVFFGAKAACSTCHAIGTEGSTLGPDLTSIGAIRSGPDILEAMVFPSASFVPGYEPFRVETKDESYSGLIASQTPDAIWLKTAQGELRLARETVKEMAPSTISLMPEGLDTALSREELLDLLAFLQSQNGDEWLQPAKR